MDGMLKASREPTKAVNVRLPVSIYGLLATTAEKEARSVTQQVLYIIRKEYEKPESTELARERAERDGEEKA